MRSAEGRSPFAGSLRVSLRYNFFPFLARKGARGMVERLFQHPAKETGPSPFVFEGGEARCDTSCQSF